MPQISRSVPFPALFLIVGVLGGIALLPVPDVAPSTYAVALALVAGVVWITAVTWRNAMSPETMAGLIHRTEHEAGRATQASGPSGRYEPTPAAVRRDPEGATP